jgi:hypothetical protein
VDEGARRLEEIIQRRIKHKYYITGVSGDLALDRVLDMFPQAGSLRVVSDELIRQLLRDEDFRRVFMQDIYLYTPEPDQIALAEQPAQDTLF